MKACKNCAHCTVLDASFGIYPYYCENEIIKDNWLRASPTQLDCYNGDFTRAYGQLDISSARGNASLCGISAQYFKPKDESNG